MVIYVLRQSRERLEIFMIGNGLFAVTHHAPSVARQEDIWWNVDHLGLRKSCIAAGNQWDGDMPEIHHWDGGMSMWTTS